MLVQCTIENFRSIKESATISFAASKDKSLEEFLLHPDNKRNLVPVIALFGANAAGKSNILYAIKTMKEMVTGKSARLLKGQKLPWEPFGECKEPTSFETVFYYHNVRYTYGFSYDENRIYSEYLYHWPNGREALIFSREDGRYEFRENVNEQIILSKRTSDNKLYLVSSNEWNLPQTENAYRWFLEKVIFMADEENDCLETVTQLLDSNEKKSRILKELMLADLGIADINVKEVNGKDPVIVTTHRITHENGEEELFQLTMNQESEGTKQFFSRIGGWLKAIETGSLLVVDEIEKSLHPLLSKRLVEMIQSKKINTGGTQLLFTSHDVMLLDLNLFRRDQIWFTEKDERTCITELYSLSSFSPRKSEYIRRGYLQGRYGAIPFIGEN